MKVKLFRFTGALNFDGSQTTVAGWEKQIGEFLNQGVRLHHIAQSSTVIPTESGPMIHTCISVWYEFDKEMHRSLVPQTVGGNSKIRELHSLLKINSGNRAVVDRRTLAHYPERFQKVTELLNELTDNGDEEKMYRLAKLFSTSASVLKLYLSDQPKV